MLQFTLGRQTWSDPRTRTTTSDRVQHSETKGEIMMLLDSVQGLTSTTVPTIHGFNTVMLPDSAQGPTSTYKHKLTENVKVWLPLRLWALLSLMHCFMNFIFGGDLNHLCQTQSPLLKPQQRFSHVKWCVESTRNFATPRAKRIIKEQTKPNPPKFSYFGFKNM